MHWEFSCFAKLENKPWMKKWKKQWNSLGCWRVESGWAHIIHIWAGWHIVEKITQHIINGMRKITKQDNFDSWFSFHNFMSWLSLSRRADFYEDRKTIPTSCKKCDISWLVISKMIRLAKYIITLQCVINVKLSLQRFWPRHKNLLIKTIPKTPQNLYVCFKSGSICCGLGNRLWGEAEIFLTFQLVKYSPLSMPKPLLTKICINQRLESSP